MMQPIVGFVSASVGVAIAAQSATVIRVGEVTFRPLMGSIPPTLLVSDWSRTHPPLVVLRFLEACAAETRDTAIEYPGPKPLFPI